MSASSLASCLSSSSARFHSSSLAFGAGYTPRVGGAHVSGVTRRAFRSKSVEVRLHLSFDCRWSGPVGIFLGIEDRGSPQQGSIWFDGVRIEEVALLNVVRRAGAPLRAWEELAQPAAMPAVDSFQGPAAAAATHTGERRRRQLVEGLEFAGVGIGGRVEDGVCRAPADCWLVAG